MGENLVSAGKPQLALELVRQTVHGTSLSFAKIEPLLRKLLPRPEWEEGGTLYALQRLLLEQGVAEARDLAAQIHLGILKDAVQAGRARRCDPAHPWRTLAAATLAHLPPDLPVDWRDDAGALAILTRAVQLERDRGFLLTTTPDLYPPIRSLSEECQGQRQRLRTFSFFWNLIPPNLLWKDFTLPSGTALPAGADTDPAAADATRLADLAAAVTGSQPSTPQAKTALACLLAWPDRAAAEYILRLGSALPAVQAYAMHALALRTGNDYATWGEWADYLRRTMAERNWQQATASRLLSENRAELRLLWYTCQTPQPDPVLLEALTAAVAESAHRTVQPADFVRRREAVLTPADVARLQGLPVPPTAPAPPRPAGGLSIPPGLGLPPVLTEPIAPQSAAARLSPMSPPILPRIIPTPAPEPEKPAAPPEPSLWEEHIQPFLTANWYILAGLLMVVAGASLLAYFTWDKSLLVRYLFLPVLLAAFTGGLAELGLRLTRRHPDLRATGTFLLGGAICLLPANFMVLCRAGDDPQAARLLLPALALYAAAAGAGLWRWCGEVRRELRPLLALPLLAVNLLAVLGDMPGVRDAAAGHRSTLVPFTITAAVLLVLAVANRFLRLVLTRELLDAKCVPWFFGITLAATTLQVSAWRHFHLGITPHPRDYALAVILAGAALLRWERRAGELRNTGAAYGGESFLGYAALFLGILMAAGNQHLRVIALLLAGGIWLVQAPRRPGIVHYWIGVTLCLLGGAATGMLETFPKRRELNLLPELGFALALAAGAARALAGRFREPRLRQVALEIQPPILLVTALVAVLSQYHLRSAPWQTGLILLAVAGFFAVRATVTARRDWLHIAAVSAGLALPYLGCADMTEYRFDENTLGLGFGLLAAVWLAAARFLPSATWRRTGGRIVTAFGLAGIAGLLLRLLLACRPEIGGAELAGGVLLAVALGVTAWRARSRLPAMSAAGTLAVILPLFRVPAAAAPERWHHGTGLVSAAVAFLLTLVCFQFRRALAEPVPAIPAPAPDPAAPTRPGAVSAAALVTIPILSAAFWLCGKALILQLQNHHGQIPFIAAIALVSATFYAAAIYFRQRPAGSGLFHLSWPLLAAGIAMGCDQAGCEGLAMLEYPLLWTGVAFTLLTGVEALAARRQDWAETLLARPRREILACGSILVTVIITMLVIQLSESYTRHTGLQALAIFTAAQLVWHALRTSQRRFGAVLFVLTTAWLFAAPDAAERNFGALPLFLLAVLTADLALEGVPGLRAFLRPLQAPFIAGVTLLGAFLAFLAAGLPDSLIHAVGTQDLLNLTIPPAETGMLLAAMLLIARTQNCAFFVLPAAALGYQLLLLPCTLNELFRPWRLADFALVLCLLPFAGGMLRTCCPRLLQGPTPQVPAAETLPQAPWLTIPALGLALGAAFGQMALSSAGITTDTRGMQTLAPFAAVLAFALAGLYWRRGGFWTVAAGLLPAANLFAIAVLRGRELLDAQMTEVHILCLALVLTLAEFALARKLVLKAALTTAAHRLHLGCAALAGTILLLIGVNYLANPDLTTIPTIRFLTSGLLALAAGLYFRGAARRPENLPTRDGLWLESFWHAALALALWCGALMIPALRTPHAALYALALPALACWVAAEFSRRTAPAAAPPPRLILAERFATSATVFAGLVLILYGSRLPFQMLLFPNLPPDLHLYHTGAPAAVLMGLILIRIRGLGGATWTAFTGGLALMAGTYFSVTWLPGLSPFDFPMAGAWTALGAAHLLILLSYQQSPLRSFIQDLGGIGAEEWHAHRRQWGLFLTAAVHVAVLSGLLQDYSTHSLETTPLLLALATVLLHQAVIGAPWAKAYYVLAGLEILAALHLDFFLPAGAPGLIPAKQVVWYLLTPWLAAALLWSRLKEWVPARAVWNSAGGLALLCAAHLVYHGPRTGVGLLIALLMLLAALRTPRPEDAPPPHPLPALLLGAPLWFVYFGTLRLTGDHADGWRPLLAGAAALLATGMLARFADALHDRLRQPGRPEDSAQPAPDRFLAHEVLDLCRRRTEAVARTLLWLAFAILSLVTSPRNDSLDIMLALAFVWGVGAVAWYREGRFRDGVLPYAASLLSLAGAWIVLRRLLFRHFDFWTYEYDIWLGLGASIAFSAAKRLVRHQQPGLSRTITGTVWLLPVLQCLWLLTNHMSADLTLLVIGIQAMLFAWQGGGKRDSPYNAVAMLGFVSFICLLFWAKLDLRCIQAYVLPAGFGVLGLLWLFGSHVPPPLRHAIRLVTVLGMLGSCGYYALLDNRYPVSFHLTMLLLCLIVMAFGPLLRVRLYLGLGFAGFATDLIALVVKEFRTLDRSLQMMGIGLLLLLLGVAVVGGAIFYKTNRDALRARCASLGARFGVWE